MRGDRCPRCQSPPAHFAAEAPGCLAALGSPCAWPPTDPARSPHRLPPPCSLIRQRISMRSVPPEPGCCDRQSSLKLRCKPSPPRFCRRSSSIVARDRPSRLRSRPKMYVLRPPPGNPGALRRTSRYPAGVSATVRAALRWSAEFAVLCLLPASLRATRTPPADGPRQAALAPPFLHPSRRNRLGTRLGASEIP